ncbi:MAG: hypothetical protein ABR976_07350 [Terracidiphilus sp.]
MKTTIRKLASAMFVLIATLGAGQTESAPNELRVQDIRAQQTEEQLKTSAPCLRAMESPTHHIAQSTVIDPKTLAKDLSTLMQESDEVVLAGHSYAWARVLSPSGESAVDYFDVNVMRSWKGSHHVGDVLTFALPAGAVYCGMTESHQTSYFLTKAGTPEWKNTLYLGPFVLFLRPPQGKDTQLVQTLFPAGGQGLQGMFQIQIPPTDEAWNPCTGVMVGTMKWCDSMLDTSDYPIQVPYVHDPLAKKYDGMRIAEFLQEVRNVAQDQGLDEKSTATERPPQ